MVRLHALIFSIHFVYIAPRYFFENVEANNNLPTSGLPAIAAITTTFSDSNFRYGGALNHNGKKE